MQHTPNIKYGQNIFMSSEKLDQAAALKQAVEAWWSETQFYASQEIVLSMEVYNQGVGHFTQVIQANVKEVGCSVHYCKDGTYVICNYD
jgi:hypothetical protein